VEMRSFIPFLLIFGVGEVMISRPRNSPRREGGFSE
jgi:hypothetical protein